MSQPPSIGPIPVQPNQAVAKWRQDIGNRHGRCLASIGARLHEDAAPRRLANSVTHWMLRDRFGRLGVPVGVAYGSDLRCVKKDPLRVAGEHPDVVKGSRIVQNPYVLFLAFGDSALEFEPRVSVLDIGKRLMVLSDLNFAIDRTFREAGIDIPFPQRDVHLIRPAPPATG